MSKEDLEWFKQKHPLAYARSVLGLDPKDKQFQFKLDHDIKAWEPDLSLDIPSPEEVEAHRTPRGGFTRKTLAQWGVPWPPPFRWRERLSKAYKKKHQPK